MPAISSFIIRRFRAVGFVVVCLAIAGTLGSNASLSDHFAVEIEAARVTAPAGTVPFESPKHIRKAHPQEKHSAGQACDCSDSHFCS